MKSRWLDGDGFVPQEERVTNIGDDHLGHMIVINLQWLDRLIQDTEQLDEVDEDWVKEILETADRAGRLSVGAPTRADLDKIEWLENELLMSRWKPVEE